MSTVGSKIPKACEPCRRRKIRCNGLQPCTACRGQPAQCAYRAKARDRRSAIARITTSPGISVDQDTSEQSSHPQTDEQVRVLADPKVYHGITATHTTGADSGECAQLFYGPSSNFAFLQQLHRSILHSVVGRQLEMHEEREGGEGLDMFVQRSIFFGTQSKINTAHLANTGPLKEVVPFSQASNFLSHFTTKSIHILPLFTTSELEDLLQELYSDAGQTGLRSQQKALILGVLAIGALHTAHTDKADYLYEQAKITAAPFDEAVTLTMIQLSILLGDYQINMGRPNSAYLHLGNAVRRAFAMGLNRQAAGSLSNDPLTQKRRSIMWCLYFHER